MTQHKTYVYIYIYMYKYVNTRINTHTYLHNLVCFHIHLGTITVSSGRADHQTLDYTYTKNPRIYLRAWTGIACTKMNFMWLSLRLLMHLVVPQTLDALGQEKLTSHPLDLNGGRNLSCYRACEQSQTATGRLFISTGASRPYLI